MLSRIIKKNWYINVYSQDNFSIVEVTDHAFPWVSVELLRKVISLAFRDSNYVAVSQFVDREQWDIGNQDTFLRTMTNEYSYPYFISSNFGTIEDGNLTDNTFVINLVGSPEQSWLDRVIGFGMSNNPNILYGLHSYQDNWFSQITGWNLFFRKWFDLISDSTEMKKIVSDVQLMSWNSDDHQYFALKGDVQKEILLDSISNLAHQNSLNMIVKYGKDV